MKKQLDSFFPGKRISSSQEAEFIEKVYATLERNSFKLLNCYDFQEVLLDFTKSKIYLLYNHPIHDFMRKVFAVSKYDVITFLLQNINPALGDGIDLIIFDDSVKQLLLFNHDGDSFYIDCT